MIQARGLRDYLGRVLPRLEPVGVTYSAAFLMYVSSHAQPSPDQSSLWVFLTYSRERKGERCTERARQNGLPYLTSSLPYVR